MNSNNVNGVIPPSSTSTATSLKTPEGRYKLNCEMAHPSSLLHYVHGKTDSQLTLAYLKEKPTSSVAAPSSTSSSTGGVRSAAARLLGTSNGARALSFAGGSGVDKIVAATTRTASMSNSSIGSRLPLTNLDGKGMYLLFNVGDTIYISDLNSCEKDPIKSVHFGNSNPVCHAFNTEAKDGHDLLIGLNSGDVYSASLRQQLQDFGKRLIGAYHYNKDSSISSSRCMSVSWVPEGNVNFVVAYADGNLFVYEKGKDGTIDPCFPLIKDQNQFSVALAKSSKSNPIARWHVCEGSINSIAFSGDGTHLATVGRDGYPIALMGLLVVPLRRCPPGGLPTYSAESQSNPWDNVPPSGSLQPAPSMRDIFQNFPHWSHRVHTEPLSGLILTQDSILTSCREGRIKVWTRPESPDSTSSNS